ncbi:thioesterase domain-containing protein [Alteromonas sp. 1_MG-2023]|uniref:lipase family protein n=1 Tax=Alteromonas sp. 1_MG-2023 TaxID=3062669 RepID=UPI0026E1A0E5|nr:thioesterase domain-containing protein [Alteromonas sp. 1_MG-2023]MDO6567299.1 thioesterase domain-containing protein [Alteromonas sp. 1_MG-2023]
MKKLKRYQYERYAILCQLAYPDAEAHYRQILNPFYERHLVDKYGRMSVRILWVDNKKEAIVVFRGSLGVRDWLANLVFLPTKIKQIDKKFYVHWGFKRLLNQPMYSSTKTIDQALPLRELLVKVLEPLQKKGKRFTFIGHSSGGAVAVLMADYFERKNAKAVKRVVTFGQPAVGSRSWYKSYLLHHKTYRICCDLDVVTFMPPFPFYFWHVGKMLWLHDDQIYENTPTHERFLKSLRSWLLRPITYHYMRKYIRNKSLFDEH